MELQLPEWYLDAQRQTQDMTFGRIPLELVVANGQVTKVVGTRNTSTKFKSNDDALLYILDHVRTTLNKETQKLQDEPDNPQNGGTISIGITHKNGKVSLVNTFDTLEFNYPMY
jgi:hypothetical protein